MYFLLASKLGFERGTRAIVMPQYDMNLQDSNYGNRLLSYGEGRGYPALDMPLFPRINEQ